jgi:hypothetical protein
LATPLIARIVDGGTRDPELDRPSVHLRQTDLGELCRGEEARHFMLGTDSGI